MDALLASRRLPSEPLGGGNIEAIWRRDPLTEPDSSRETVESSCKRRTVASESKCCVCEVRPAKCSYKVRHSQIETMNSVLCIMLARRI